MQHAVFKARQTPRAALHTCRPPFLLGFNCAALHVPPPARASCLLYASRRLSSRRTCRCTWPSRSTRYVEALRPRFRRFTRLLNRDGPDPESRVNKTKGVGTTRCLCRERRRAEAGESWSALPRWIGGELIDYRMHIASRTYIFVVAIKRR